MHIFCNFFNNIFGSSCTISIGCTFCAISLIIFSVHHLASFSPCTFCVTCLTSSQIFLHAHCLQILCNFMWHLLRSTCMIIFACKFCAILLTYSYQIILHDHCLYILCNLLTSSQTTVCNCAILSTSSQIVLHILANSVQFYCCHLRSSCIITHYKFIHIFSEHLATSLLAFSVQFSWHLLRSACMICCSQNVRASP